MAANFMAHPAGDAGQRCPGDEPGLTKAATPNTAPFHNRIPARPGREFLQSHGAEKNVPLKLPFIFSGKIPFGGTIEPDVKKNLLAFGTILA